MVWLHGYNPQRGGLWHFVAQCFFQLSILHRLLLVAIPIIKTIMKHYYSWVFPRYIYIYTIYYIPLYSNDISMIPQVYPNKPHILSRQEPSSRSFQEIQEKRREEWRKLGIEAREFITGNYDGRWWVRGWCYPDTNQWEIQDPIDGGTLVLYFWPYFAGIFPEI